MYYNYIIVFLCIVSLSGLFFYILKLKPNKKTDIKELYSQGLDMMINGLQRSAYNNFKKIVELDSENIKAYLRLGQVLRESGNVNKALKIHKGLLIRQNLTSYDLSELHKNLALDYFEINKIDKAIEQALEILKVDRKNTWAISKLITFHKALNQWDKASEYLEKLNKINGKSDLHKLGLFIIQEGRNLQSNKEFKLARNKFEKALSVSPDLSASYFFIAETFSNESEEYFQEAEKNHDKNSEEYKKYFNKALETLSKAIPMWIKYANSNPQQSWMVIHLLKDALFALDRYDELEQILKDIIKKDRNNSEVVATLADMYAHKGDLNNALDIVDSNIHENSDSLIIKLIRLKLLSLEGKQNISKGLDDMIHFLVRDEGYHIYKNTPPDKDIIWVYENNNEVQV